MPVERRSLVLGALGAAAFAPGAAHAQQRQKFLILRGGANSGSWFTGTAVVAKLVNEKLPHLNMTATLGGGVRNPTDIQSGSAQYGFSIGRSVVEAYDGLAPFTRKHDKVRVMCAFFPTMMLIVARQSSNIRTFGDLIGRRVGPGTRAFTTSQIFEELLRLSGHSMRDVNAVFMNFADANQAFQDGQLDAVMSMTGNPSPSYLELDTLAGIRVVSIEEPLIQRFVEANPGYTRAVVPGGSYPKWQQESFTVMSPTVLITSADAPADEVYQIMKVVFEGRDQLVAANTAYRDFRKETAASDGFGHVPLHEGAARYWREIGALA